MKKITSFFMALCMFLFCGIVPAFATIPEQIDVSAKVSVTSARNIDYWNTNGMKSIDNETITVRPGSGKNLKLHLYIETGVLTIVVKEYGSLPKTFTWSTPGHHYADLCIGTKNTKYTILMYGGAMADGGIYSEP